MIKVEEAVKKHAEGFNCCQAVACVFAEEMGVDEALLYKMGEAFGAGMGTAQGVCGAMSGAAMLAGLKNSDGDIKHPAGTKASTMKLVSQMQKEFVEKAKGLLCKDIKTGNDGKAFTSCDDCIRIATEIAEEHLLND